MLSIILPIVALLLGVALLLLGTGLLNTLLALRGGLEGYGDGTLGMVMAGYFVGFFVGTWLALPVIHRIGHIRTFALCAAIGACSALLHLFFANPWSWFGLRVLTGSTIVTLYTVVESWLNHQTPAPQRGRVFATYMAVNLGSLAAAQQLLRLGTPEGFALFVIAAMLIILGLVPVTWTRLPQPAISRVPRLGFRTLWRTAPVAVAGAVLSGLAMGAFWGLGAAWAGQVGLDSAGVALFMSAVILGGALGQYPLGRYSDRHDRRRVLAVVTAVAALLAIALALSARAGFWVLVPACLYGAVAFAVYPVSVAHLVDRLEPQDILSGGSGLLLLHGIGAAAGPALAGQLMAGFGPVALPLWFAASQLVLSLFAARKVHGPVTEPPEHPARFVPMVRTAPTALTLRPSTVEPVQS